MLKTPSLCYETAYLMINCEQGSEESIIEQLRMFPEVKEIRSTFGSYDILIKIQAQSVESLRDLITFRIRKIPTIRATTTLMCAKHN